MSSWLPPTLRSSQGGSLRLPPVTLGLVLAVAVIGIAALLYQPTLYYLATPTAGFGPWWHVWRPFTHAFVTTGVLPLILGCFFTGWLGMTVEKQFGSLATALVSANGALAAAVVLQWTSPFAGLTLGSGAISWALMGAWLWHTWRNHRDMQQLVFVGVLVVANIALGGDAVILLIGLAIGVGTTWLWEFAAKKTPTSYYDAFNRQLNRRRQRRPLYFVGGLTAALFLAWWLRFLVG